MAEHYEVTEEKEEDKVEKEKEVSQGSTEAREGVEASIDYLSSKNVEAIYVASTPGQAKAAAHEGTYSTHSVWIKNARLEEREFSLDKEGFLLAEHVSPVSDYFNDELLREVYDQSIVELVKRQTGASRVEVFDHTRRAASEDLRVKLRCREPSKVVHNDYTEASAVKRLRTLYESEADDLLEKRFAIINVWRSMAGEVQNNSMAFCDSNSRSLDDIVSVKRIANDRVGEVQMAVFDPQHCWYYFPHLKPDELLMFKTFDSNTDTNRFTLHTSFDNHSREADPRQSIESRCFVFY